MAKDADAHVPEKPLGYQTGDFRARMSLQWLQSRSMVMKVLADLTHEVGDVDSKRIEV